jgi:hypothetical protein
MIHFIVKPYPGRSEQHEFNFKGKMFIDEEKLGGSSRNKIDEYK